MTREEWLKERKKGIGASESSAVLGLNPYKTNVELWMEKTSRVEPEDIGHKPYVKYGVDAELHLRELFRLDYPEFEVGYEEFKIIRHPDHPFIFATLDGELTNRDTGERGILEIKTTEIMASMHREKWNDRIPENYYTQLLQQLLVTGWDFAILKAHLRTTWGDEVRINTRHYTVRREDVLHDIEYLKGELVTFWQDYVLKDRKPNLILPAI